MGWSAIQEQEEKLKIAYEDYWTELPNRFRL
jgi:hypothetical protein